MTMVSPMIIGGEEVAGRGEPWLVRSPWDHNRDVGQCWLADESMSARITEAAQSGYNHWRRQSRQTRIDVLNNFADRLDKARETVARLAAQETGKPLRLAREEAAQAVSLVRRTAESLKSIQTSTRVHPQGLIETHHKPSGPAIALTSFAMPILDPVDVIVSALSAGTSLTLRPSLKASMTALLLGAMMVGAGFDALSVVPSAHAEGEHLLADPSFDVRLFTGRHETALYFKTLLGHRRQLQTRLESTHISWVGPDAQDIDQVARILLHGACDFAGQLPMRLQGVLVHPDTEAVLMHALVTQGKKLRVGDPMDPKTDLGPMITLDHLHMARLWLQTAVQHKVNIAFGGSTYNALSYNPTVLNRFDAETSLFWQVPAAPLLAVMKCENPADLPWPKGVDAVSVFGASPPLSPWTDSVHVVAQQTLAPRDALPSLPWQLSYAQAGVRMPDAH